jgi:hypothetical protein
MLATGYGSRGIPEFATALVAEASEFARLPLNRRN